MSDELAELRRLAALRREARRRLADVTAEHGQRSARRAAPARDYAEVTDWWATEMTAAVATGQHTIADVARAAGCAPSSVHYRFRSAWTVAVTTGA